MRFEEAKQETYTANFSSQLAFKQAEEKGLAIVLPDEFTLQIDIDSETSFSIFKTKISYLEKWYDLKYKTNFSLSGNPCRHIYVTMPISITPLGRIFLQLFLGSDSTREFLSFQRIANNDPNPTLFFEKKA